MFCGVCISGTLIVIQKLVLLGTQKLFFVISEDAEFDKIMKVGDCWFACLLVVWRELITVLLLFLMGYLQICLLCRQRGHSLKNCPIKNDENMDKKLCYNYGETGHSLAKCPQPLQDGTWPFSSTKNALIGFCK